MKIDMPTLIFALTLAEAASTLGLAIMMRSLSREPALRFWVALKALGVLGLGSLSFRAHLPTIPSIFVTNMALMTCYALAWSGARVFNRRPVLWAWVIIIPCAAMVPIAWYTVFDPSAMHRTLISAHVYCFFAALCAIEHFRGEVGAKTSTPRQRMVGATFLVLAATWFWTIWAVPLNLNIVRFMEAEFSTLSLMWTVSFVADIAYALGVIAISYERLHREIEATSLRMRELVDQQRQFSLMLSHEFRNPLAAIGRAAEYMIHTATELTPRHVERLSTIRARVTVLNDLVDTFLIDEAQRAELDDAHQDLIDLATIWERIEANVAAGHGWGAVERLRPDTPSYPVAFLGHGTSLVTAVSTLIDNALKYADAPSPVELTLAAQDDRIIFTVTDQGIGIPKADLPKMPRRFFRGANARVKPGSGLGLSMVAWVAERHGGKLELESVEGEGTTARLILPWRRPSQSDGDKMDAKSVNA